MRTNLKLLRIRHNLSQEDMAKLIGCSRATYSAIELGQRDGSLGFWKALKNRFDISSADMWDIME